MEIEPEVLECMEDIIKKVIKKEQRRKYYQKNKDKRLQQQKEYYLENKEKRKKYRQTPKGIKSRRIYDWKRHGVICDNWNALYDHYLKTSYCDFCRCELTYDKNTTATTKCLDHDHTITNRPNFRNILCNSCNIKRK